MTGKCRECAKNKERLLKYRKFPALRKLFFQKRDAHFRDQRAERCQLLPLVLLTYLTFHCRVTGKTTTTRFCCHVKSPTSSCLLSLMVLTCSSALCLASGVESKISVHCAFSGTLFAFQKSYQGNGEGKHCEGASDGGPEPWV